MALVRATALKDFRNTGLSTTDVSTAYQLGALTTGQKFYAGLALTSASLGTTARVLSMLVQSATASGFGTPVTRATFVLSTVQGAEWAVPAGGLSTEHSWWRANWTLTTGAPGNTTGGVWKGLIWAGFK